MTVDEYIDTDICEQCRFHSDKQCLGVASDKIHCYYYLNEMLPRLCIQRHGRWINDMFCSECKRFPVDVSVSISNRELTKYFSRCPHCGARMK